GPLHTSTTLARRTAAGERGDCSASSRAATTDQSGHHTTMTLTEPAASSGGPPDLAHLLVDSVHPGPRRVHALRRPCSTPYDDSGTTLPQVAGARRRTVPGRLLDAQSGLGPRPVALHHQHR